MIPRVKILGVFAREDGELVADLIELDVRCSFRHRVGPGSYLGNVNSNYSIALWLVESSRYQ